MAAASAGASDHANTAASSRLAVPAGDNLVVRKEPAGPSRYKSGSSARTPRTREASTGFAINAAASHCAGMPLTASEPMSTRS
jgi:hypothetical protein